MKNYTLVQAPILAFPHVPASKRIALEIVEPPERKAPVKDFPVSVGLVFLRGELDSSSSGAVVDDLNNPVPFEAEATGWWSPIHDSVKWLLLHFRAWTNRRYFFDPDGDPLKPPGAPLATTDQAGITVSTGPLEVRLSFDQKGLFDQVLLNGNAVLATNYAVNHTLVTDDGTKKMPCALGSWKLTLEENTPARVVLNARDYFDADPNGHIAQLDLRIQFFKGETFIRLYHTLTWMVQDPTRGVRELSLSLPLQLQPQRTVRVGLSDLRVSTYLRRSMCWHCRTGLRTGRSASVSVRTMLK
jgi:hypothetical protein